MTILKMPDNQYLMVGALCLLFAITGGVGGYHLKSRMQDPGKPEPITGLPVSSAGLNLGHNKTKEHCEPSATEKSPDTMPASTNLVIGADDTKRINQLIKQIHTIATRQGIDLNLDTQLKTESEFASMLDQMPTLIHPLLTIYQQMPDSETRDFFRSLLTLSGSGEIENRALEYLQSGHYSSRASWLELLRDNGVKQASTRKELFNLLPMLGSAQETRDALLAISPAVVSSAQRLEITSQLSNYVNHPDDIVRSAAVESLSKWADNSHAHIIAQALTDSSQRVRYTAISAAQYSGIQSNYIELMLLDIMNDTNEDWQLRMHAHNALSSFPLQGQSYDLFYEFRQQMIADENSSGASG